MEKIKVNMSPNPLDIQTIHCSQGDTEAREWGFELHNNGDAIDSSSISDQLVFKAYEGGTEQILPENGSVPVTSPFLGDIRYPQGLLTDQEFLYRESPSDVDGYAKFTSIKGNTVKFNQLVQKINSQTGAGVTITQNDNGSVTVNGTATSIIYIQLNNDYRTIIGNKYYCSLNNANVPEGFSLYNDGGGLSTSNSPIVAEATQQKRIYIRIATGTTVNNLTVYPQCIDLTAIFGSGNEPATPEAFETWLSNNIGLLPYYDYNQGVLLSFNGNGIKTVGKNLFDFSQFANGTITFENGILTGTTGQFYAAYRDVVNNGIELKYPKNTQITISFDARTEQNDAPTGGGLYFVASENGIRVQLATTANNTTAIQHISVTIPSSRHIDKLGWSYGSNPNNIWHITNFQVEFGPTETSYEPYTSSTLSLPISTYFSTGMKSAGTVYDELTPTKGITRIGAVDLGSLDWRRNPNANGAFNCRVADMKLGVNGQLSSVICPLYETVNTKYYGQMSAMQNMQIAQSNATQGELYLINTSYNDVTAFKTAMTGVYLYYELATPTETSFTTASLVTENAEITLSNEDGVLIGKCTEQLSSESGFIDAKIKLADADGECYSNKIQLHIERSPQ